MKNKIIIHF